MIEANPGMATVDRVEPAPWGAFGARGPMEDSPFANAVENFYMTDPVSRASETMADCTAAFVVGKEEATGTDG